MDGRCLSVGAVGEEVRTLHNRLRRAGHELPESETSRAFFGPGTREVLRQIQVQHGLQSHGELDAPADSLIAAGPRQPVGALVPSASSRSGSRVLDEHVVESKIKITKPRLVGGRSVVGPGSLRLKGWAKVRKHIVEEWWYGGVPSGHTERDEWLTEGFRVTTDVDGESREVSIVADDPRRGPDNDGEMRWSERWEVPSASDMIDIAATLSGTVRLYRMGPFTTGSAPEQYVVSEFVWSKAEGVCTVDRKGPELGGINRTAGKGPPYRTVIEGTAVDRPVGVQSVAWEFGGLSGLALDHGDDWATWSADVSLPDRRSEHVITITATDRVGNSTQSLVRIPADKTPPVVVRTAPIDNPHPALWHDPHITVPVQGTAVDVDGESKIKNVRWQLNNGAETAAAQTGEDWSTWRALVGIESPGSHTVAFWATDMAGNESAHQTLKINVQILG